MSHIFPAALHAVERKIPSCTRCPELRAYCAQVGIIKRKAFQDWDYWARPVPGFGDPAARLWIIGLAPAAHGGNRTGRMFTGDASGDFLYAALHRAGLANQPTSISRVDGLCLHGVYISAALRCAPPGNKPTVEELAHCRPYLAEELALLKNLRAVVALGKIAWGAALQVLCSTGVPPVSVRSTVVSPVTIARTCDPTTPSRPHAPRPHALPSPRPRFAHAAEIRLGSVTLLGSYHVSQQNTFTGRLTPRMLDAVLSRALTV